MGEPISEVACCAAKKFSLQITVAAILRRLMELKAGQVEGALWEVLKVEAKAQLGR